MGDGEKSRNKVENNNQKNFRRSIYAKHDLPVGHILKQEDLNWLRPAEGIEPGNEDKIIGKKIISLIKAGDLIELKSVK